MDKFRKGKSNFATTLVTGIGTGTSETITLNSTAGLPTDTEIVLTFNRVTSSGVVNPTSLVERIRGKISGSTLTAYTRGVDNTTEQAHSGGTVVEYIPNAEDMNDLVDGILVEHNQDGTHDTTKVVDLSTAQTLTNKTLTSPVINTPTGDVATLTGTQTLTNKTLTSPKINEDVSLTASATELNLLDGVSEVADVSHRQGGSSTDWATVGTTNYTESDVLIQSGSASCTISSGQQSGVTAEITFPAAFAGTPLVFCTVDDSGKFNTFDETPFLLILDTYPTSTKAKFVALTRQGAVAADRTFAIHWLAIGKKSS